MRTVCARVQRRREAVIAARAHADAVAAAIERSARQQHKVDPLRVDARGARRVGGSHAVAVGHEGAIGLRQQRLHLGAGGAMGIDDGLALRARQGGQCGDIRLAAPRGNRPSRPLRPPNALLAATACAMARSHSARRAALMPRRPASPCRRREALSMNDSTPSLTENICVIISRRGRAGKRSGAGVLCAGGRSALRSAAVRGSAGRGGTPFPAGAVQGNGRFPCARGKRAFFSARRGQSAARMWYNETKARGAPQQGARREREDAGRWICLRRSSGAPATAARSWTKR